MKCVVLTGTDVKGCTYHLKEMFLQEIKPDELIEFSLPKDSPNFCIGCKKCFLESEKYCPHASKVDPIWNSMLEADLIVFVYPVYVMRAPGHIKTLLDHLGVHWFAHRPNPLMFPKTAAIITQSIGAPNGGAQKDVRTSLEWLGVSKIRTLGFAMSEGVIWDEISDKRKQSFERKIKQFASHFKDIRPLKMSLKSKFYFNLCKSMQKSVKKKLKEGEKPQPDLQHWIDHGWV